MDQVETLKKELSGTKTSLHLHSILLEEARGDQHRRQSASRDRFIQLERQISKQKTQIEAMQKIAMDHQARYTKELQRVTSELSQQVDAKAEVKVRGES